MTALAHNILKMQINAFYTSYKAKINDKVLTMNIIFEQAEKIRIRDL